jgi:hypothetical protein
MAESFLKRASKKLGEAEGHLKQLNYPESISSSQECIELSVARAHAQFAEGLWRAFRKWEFLAYSLKYKAIVLREALKGLF